MLKHQLLPQRRHQAAGSIVAVGMGLPRRDKSSLSACRWCMNNGKQKALKNVMAIETTVDTDKRTRRRAKPPDIYELLGQLDAVEMRLLQWLLRYPFQRAEDLAFATGSSSATASRHLNLLYNRGLIERVMPAALGTGKCWLYHLSNLGLQVLAVLEQADATDLARVWRTDERGLL